MRDLPFKCRSTFEDERHAKPLIVKHLPFMPFMPFTFRARVCAYLRVRPSGFLLQHINIFHTRICRYVRHERHERHLKGIQ